MSCCFLLGRSYLFLTHVTVVLEAISTCMSCSFLQENIISHMHHKLLNKIQNYLGSGGRAQFNSIFGGSRSV